MSSHTDGPEKFYLTFDIETYPDKNLFRKVEGKLVKDWQQERKDRGRSDFLPTPYHIPIAIGILVCNESYKVQRLEVKFREIRKEKDLLAYFWKTVSSYIGCEEAATYNFQLISFNGRGFDLPVIEQRSLKFGTLSCPAYFDEQDRWQHYRSRYARSLHFDIMEFVTNYAASERVKLDALIKLAGLPGKTGLKGSEVEKAYDDRRYDEIKRYVLLDVLQTYLLFLKCQVLCGRNDAYLRGRKLLLEHLRKNKKKRLLRFALSKLA